MDTFSQIIQLVGYILLLVTIALLWRKAAPQPEAGRYWGLLAAARTMNLFGNIAWIVHDLVTKSPLGTFSVIDLIYVLSYVLIGRALWLYPAPLSRRVWLWVGGAMLAMNVVIWAIYFNPTRALWGGDLTDFLGMAVYPVLDAGIVVLAGLRVRATRQFAWSQNAILLFCSVASYGIANLINLTEHVFEPVPAGILTNVFWILADVFLLVMVLKGNSREENPGLIRNEG